MVSHVYGKRESNGEDVPRPPKGWVILEAGRIVPKVHRECIEDYVSGRCDWAFPRRCHSTMTPLTARVSGGVRAIAIPTEDNQHDFQ